MPDTINVIVDENNEHSWERIETTYDEYGEIQTRVVTYDNGIEEFEEYYFGQLQNKVAVDTLDVFNWQYKGEVYDGNGALVERGTEFDDGVAYLWLYEAGQLTDFLQIDSENVKTWDLIGTTYNEIGQIEERSVTYDSGVAHIWFYQDGKSTNSVKIDPENVEPWHIVQTYYDASGQIENRETRYDDGQIKFEYFENGTRISTEQLDGFMSWETAPVDGGAKAWESIYTSYDASGVISGRTIAYDNGAMKEETYVDGVKADAMLLDVLDNASWDTIEFNYDENGKIANTTTIFDDSTSRQSLYENGVLNAVYRFDAEDGSNGVYDWYGKLDLYAPDGQLMISGTEYDNGDEVYLIYQDGEKLTRIENDADGSDPWLMKVTDYSGQDPITTLYDNVDDIPEEYQDFFWMGTV